MDLVTLAAAKRYADTKSIGTTIKIVEELPSVGESNFIYFVLSDSSSDGTYDEYVFIDDEWEPICSTRIDLSDYMAKTAFHYDEETETLSITTD